MEMKAAVLYEPNKPLEIETLQLDDPKDGEVLVRMAAAGVCYSDYHVMKGEWTMPLPIVLRARRRRRGGEGRPRGHAVEAR